MNCPYCKKKIEGITGFQEVTKFQKHLKSCRKNPNNKFIITTEGNIIKSKTTLLEALEIRSNSGQ